MVRAVLVLIILLTASSCQRISTATGGGGQQKAEIQYDEKQSNPHPNNPGN